jgi:amidase
MFDEALAHAAELDGFMSIHGKPKGPLHGLPISVKEHVFLTGTPATSGFIAWADDISKSDALIVKVLRDAGAVFHVKTTNPQGLMVSSSMALLGRYINPIAGPRNGEQSIRDNNESFQH